jgi:excisionase family DNA binding protein
MAESSTTEQQPAPETDSRPPLVDVSVVATRFGLSPWTVLRLAKRHQIPSYRAGRSYRFDLDEVEAALKVAA